MGQRIFHSARGRCHARSRCRRGQFAFYFRYPGPDGKFGPLHPDQINEANGNFFGLDTTNDQDSKDDIVTAEMAIPVNREIHLLMHSKDVGHSFYVPELRVQQDFVPGLDLIGSFHRNKDRQVRNRLHPALRPRPLQHEGVSRSEVARKITTNWIKQQAALQ